MKNSLIIIITIIMPIMMVAQSLNYAEDSGIGLPYPYKDYPPGVQTV